MAKFYNNRVKTGKLAGSVFAIRNGETIERAYQPIVSNPNTPAQVASRAKLKLMSQLSAVMSPVIAMPRVGAVSPRNRFVKENYSKTSYATDTASVNLLAIQLTKSVVALPSLVAVRTGAEIAVNLAFALQEGASRVVYACFVKQSDETLRYLTSSVVDVPSVNGDYPTTFTLDSPGLDVIIYAYAIRDNTSAANVAFGNMQVPTAQTVAQLITSRTLTDADVTLSETQAVESLHQA